MKRQNVPSNKKGHSILCPYEITAINKAGVYPRPCYLFPLLNLPAHCTPGVLGSVEISSL